MLTRMPSGSAALAPALRLELSVAASERRPLSLLKPSNRPMASWLPNDGPPGQMSRRGDGGRDGALRHHADVLAQECAPLLPHEAGDGSRVAVGPQVPHRGRIDAQLEAAERQKIETAAVAPHPVAG